MTIPEWLETLASMDNPAMVAIGQEMVDRVKALEGRVELWKLAFRMLRYENDDYFRAYFATHDAGKENP